MKVPANAEANPPTDERDGDAKPRLSHLGRYMRMIMRDPDFERAVYLVMAILGHALHSTHNLSEILDEVDTRFAYLQFVLGVCRQVSAACDLPPVRAKKLMGAALYSYVRGWTPSDARVLAREAAALEGAPGLEAAFAAGYSATLTWLMNDELEADELFRMLSLDPVLAPTHPVTPCLH